jgi:hypothetical protein
MNNRQAGWLWAAAALSFVVGLILVWKDSAAGWIFFIIGLVDIGLSLRPGRTWTGPDLSLVRWGLVGVTGLLVLLVLIVGGLFLLK